MLHLYFHFIFQIAFTFNKSTESGQPFTEKNKSCFIEVEKQLCKYALCSPMPLIINHSSLIRKKRDHELIIGSDFQQSKAFFLSFFFLSLQDKIKLCERKLGHRCCKEFSNLLEIHHAEWQENERESKVGWHRSSSRIEPAIQRLNCTRRCPMSHTAAQY